MKKTSTKASKSALPSEEHLEVPSPTTQDTTSSSSKGTVITITLPVVKEHKITIEGISDLNNDGVIDIKDVLIAIKQLMESSDFEDI